MNRVTPYEFSEVGNYLNAVRGALPRGTRSWSAWSHRLGYRSPRGVAMVCRGSRLPSVDMLNRVSRFLKHSPDEDRYMRLLVERERRRRAHLPTDSVEKELAQLHPGRLTESNVLPANFEAIAAWPMMVLKQLAVIPGFAADLHQVSERLFREVRSDEVRATLERLLALGYLQRRANGTYEVATDPLRTPPDVSSGALRRLHRDMALRGLASLRRDKPDEREFVALTMRFDREQIPKAKAFLRRVTREFNEMFATNEGDDVYQLNVQFFPHTRSRKKKDSPCEA